MGGRRKKRAISNYSKMDATRLMALSIPIHVL
jgi:hypothetical protein